MESCCFIVRRLVFPYGFFTYIPKKLNYNLKRMPSQKREQSTNHHFSDTWSVIGMVTGRKMIEQAGPVSKRLYAADWSAGSKYEHKRSKTLLKVKTFYDEDLYAVVLK